MVDNDKPIYKKTEKTETSYFSVFTTIILGMILVYLLLVSILFSQLMSGNFNYGSYYSAIFWITMVAIIFVFPLFCYAFYKIFTGDKTTTLKQIDTEQTSMTKPEQKMTKSDALQMQQLSNKKLTQKQMAEKEQLNQKHMAEKNQLEKTHVDEQIKYSSLPPYSSSSTPSFGSIKYSPGEQQRISALSQSFGD